MKDSRILLSAFVAGGLLSACQPQPAQEPAAEVQALVATDVTSKTPTDDTSEVPAGHKADAQPAGLSKAPGAPPPKPPPTPKPTISASVMSNAAS